MVYCHFENRSPFRLGLSLAATRFHDKCWTWASVGREPEAGVRTPNAAWEWRVDCGLSIHRDWFLEMVGCEVKNYFERSGTGLDRGGIVDNEEHGA
jgi:hypothetical protein